jgi:hypothetical protein
MREILVCVGDYGGQGNVWTALYVEDLLRPTATLMAGDIQEEFFEVFDNTSTCGENPENHSKPYPMTRAAIRKVEFKTSNSSGAAVISVTADYGKRPMTPEDARACVDEQVQKRPNAGARFFPAARRYHLDFFFDGHDYKIGPASAAAARIFTDR